MTEIKDGDKVSFNYVGTLSNGEVFDKNESGKPLEFVVGENQIIQGLEKAMLGMKKGEKKKVIVKAEDAYGPRAEQLVRKVPLSSVPEGMKVEKDIMLMVRDGEGNEIPVRVLEVEKETFTVDFNHPFAGKDLTFEVEIVSVN